MNSKRMSMLRGSLAVALAVVAVAACGGSAATTAPQASTKPTAAQSALASILALASPSAAPSASLAPSATPAASVTAEATATPAATTPPVTGSRADKCTGTSKMKDFFAEAAAKESFDVYCAVLASDWWVESGQYVLPDGGMMTAAYTNGRHFGLALIEGITCEMRGRNTDKDVVAKPGRLLCGFPDLDSVRIWLGDMGADMYVLSIPNADVIAPIPMGDIFVAFGVNAQGRTYILEGFGMSKETFAKIAKVVVKVPRP